MSTSSRPVFSYAISSLLGLCLIAAFWWWVGRPIQLEDPLPAGRKMQCASYTPFTRDQSPLVKGFVIAREQIDRDFIQLKKYFQCVRTYSVIGLEQVPEVARQHGLKVMLGAWVSTDPAETKRELDELVKEANANPDVVTSVIVGNEVLLRRELTGDQMVNYIKQVKAQVKQPVTYADVWVFWLQHPQVAPAVDFVTIHLLPYWEDEPSGIQQALETVRQVHAKMSAQYPDKRIFVGETGWPSEGRQRETAIPSRENEARFIRGFVTMAEQNGWGYNLIEAFDQPWKRLHEGVVGGYWGLFDTDREDKHVLSGPVSNAPDWMRWTLVAGAAALLLLVIAGAPSAGAVPLAPLLIGLGSALAAYHLRQGEISCRNGLEWAWNWAETALSLGCVAAAALALNKPDQGWRASLIALAGRHSHSLAVGIGFCAAVTALGLAFEPRYRSFPAAVYLAPALALLCLGRLSWLKTGPALKLLGGLLLLSLPVITYRELIAHRQELTLLVMNEQALGWLLVSLLLAVALLMGRRAPT